MRRRDHELLLSHHLQASTACACSQRGERHALETFRQEIEDEENSRAFLHTNGLLVTSQSSFIHFPSTCMYVHAPRFASGKPGRSFRSHTKNQADLDRNWCSSSPIHPTTSTVRCPLGSRGTGRCARRSRIRLQEELFDAQSRFPERSSISMMNREFTSDE